MTSIAAQNWPRARILPQLGADRLPSYLNFRKKSRPP